MNYGRSILLGSESNRYRFRGGLETTDVATRGGIFGPHGHGGGVFDGSSALGEVTWRGESSDAGVAEVQARVNNILTGMGYSNIAVDGRLGGATCGALSLIADKGTAADWDSLGGAAALAEMLTVCGPHNADWVRPVKGGATRQPPASKKPTEPLRTSAGAGPSMFAVGVIILGIGTIAFIMTGKSR